MSISDLKRQYPVADLPRKECHDTATWLIYDLVRCLSPQRPSRSDEQSSPSAGRAESQEALDDQTISCAGGDTAGRIARDRERMLELGRRQQQDERRHGFVR